MIGISGQIVRQISRSLKVRAGSQVPPQVEERILRRTMANLDTAERGLRELGGGWIPVARLLRDAGNKIAKRLLELLRQGTRE